MCAGECGHNFCRECMREHYRVKITDADVQTTATVVVSVVVVVNASFTLIVRVRLRLHRVCFVEQRMVFLIFQLAELKCPDPSCGRVIPDAEVLALMSDQPVFVAKFNKFKRAIAVGTRPKACKRSVVHRSMFVHLHLTCCACVPLVWQRAIRWLGGAWRPIATRC